MSRGDGRRQELGIQNKRVMVVLEARGHPVRAERPDPARVVDCNKQEAVLLVVPFVPRRPLQKSSPQWIARQRRDSDAKKPASSSYMSLSAFLELDSQLSPGDVTVIIDLGAAPGE